MPYLPKKKKKSLFSNINTLLLKPISATKKVGFVWKSGLFNHTKRKSQEKNKKNQSKASACLQQTSGGGRMGFKK
jgi:hypothetical protein